MIHQTSHSRGRYIWIVLVQPRNTGFFPDHPGPDVLFAGTPIPA
jgi:hypothetical protein